MIDSSSEEVGATATVEPSSALVTGGVLGALTFLLASLLLGARVAFATAFVLLIVALVRRKAAAAVAFAIAAGLCGVAILSSMVPFTWALVGAAAVLGAGLAIFARTRLADNLARGDVAMPGAAGVNG